MYILSDLFSSSFFLRCQKLFLSSLFFLCLLLLNSWHAAVEYIFQKCAVGCAVSSSQIIFKGQAEKSGVPVWGKYRVRSGIRCIERACFCFIVIWDIIVKKRELFKLFNGMLQIAVTFRINFWLIRWFIIVRESCFSNSGEAVTRNSVTLVVIGITVLALPAAFNKLERYDQVLAIVVATVVRKT